MTAGSLDDVAASAAAPASGAEAASPAAASWRSPPLPSLPLEDAPGPLGALGPDGEVALDPLGTFGAALETSPVAGVPHAIAQEMRANAATALER
jgi:hypothetical protein